MGGIARRDGALPALAVAALLVLGACSSGGSDAAKATTTAPKASTTTTTTKPDPIAPAKVDECEMLTTAELRKAVGDVAKPKAAKRDTTRNCTWVITDGGDGAKVQVFVEADPTTVDAFRKAVTKNFQGSSCTVEEADIGDAAFVESCPGQGTGMDLTTRGLHLGILLTGSTPEPEDAIQQIARAMVARTAEVA